MPRINREQIQGLQVEDTLKTELLELFDGITKAEDTIKNLQSKVPGDSQQIVEKTDYAAFQDAQKQLAEYKQKLAEKLANEQPTKTGGVCMPFLDLFTFGGE